VPAPRLPLTLSEAQARWGEGARAALGGGKPALAAAVTGTRLVALEGDLLTIEEPVGRSPGLADMATDLEHHLSALFGRPLRGRVTVARPALGDDRASRYQAAQAHPLVKDLVRRFEADVISREVVGRAEWLERFVDSGVSDRSDADPQPRDPDA
jgi:hypothetical protein